MNDSMLAEEWSSGVCFMDARRESFDARAGTGEPYFKSAGDDSRATSLLQATFDVSSMAVTRIELSSGMLVI